MLEILTFTGVDESTDIEALKEICAQHPQVEFAVLYGTRPGKGSPIFPSTEFVRRFRNLEGVRTAIHLCGDWARCATGELSRSITLGLLCNGFGRVQINLHGDDANPERVKIEHSALKRFAQQTATNSVILQHQESFDTVPIQHPRIEYLFDLSEGSGQEGFDQWPKPPAGQRAGYCGGLGPHNIAKAMEFVDRYPDSPLWLDMERNVRNGRYLFDLDKVREVCRIALGEPRD